MRAKIEAAAARQAAGFYAWLNRQLGAERVVNGRQFGWGGPGG